MGDKEIKIGSFNILNASKNAKDEKLAMIAHIINMQKFDIVALQEVFCDYKGIITAKDRSFAKPISTILEKLDAPNYWKGYFAIPPQTTDRPAKEGYAFLWNTKKVDLPTSKDNNRIYYPRIYDINTRGLKLDRNPLIGRFTFKDGQYGELRIINTHIRFSQKKTREQEDPNYPIGDGDRDSSELEKNQRRIEYYQLCQKVYSRFATRIFGSDDVESPANNAYTIMVGDYNLNLNRKWTKSPYIIEEKIILDEEYKGKKVIIQTFQEGLTTLKRITEQNEKEYNNKPKYVNNYDHATYDINRFQGIEINVGKVDAVRLYKNGDFAYFRKNVSDHIPICVTMNTSKIQ